MATYKFTFPASAAGKAVSVTDSAGAEVTTATAGAPSYVQGPIVVTKTLPVGDYVATATDAGIHYSSRAPGVLDVAAGLGASLDRVAAFVPNATVTNLGTVGASVNALRDALVAAGLMSAS